MAQQPSSKAASIIWVLLWIDVAMLFAAWFIAAIAGADSPADQYMLPIFAITAVLLPVLFILGLITQGTAYIRRWGLRATWDQTEAQRQAMRAAMRDVLEEERAERAPRLLEEQEQRDQAIASGGRGTAVR